MYKILISTLLILFLVSCNSVAKGEIYNAYSENEICIYVAEYIKETVRSFRELIEKINFLHFHPLEGATCNSDLCDGGITMNYADGVAQVERMCKKFIFVNGQPFISSKGNEFLPNVTTILRLDAFIASVYTREKAGVIMTNLTTPSRGWEVHPIFIEIERILFSWVRDTVVGSLMPWAEGDIYIESVEIDNDKIFSFAAVVSKEGGEYYLHLHFVREEAGIRLHSIEDI